jgi:hypothetical protein
MTAFIVPVYLRPLSACMHIRTNGLQYHEGSEPRPPTVPTKADETTTTPPQRSLCLYKCMNVCVYIQYAVSYVIKVLFSRTETGTTWTANTESSLLRIIRSIPRVTARDCGIESDMLLPIEEPYGLLLRKTIFSHSINICFGSGGMDSH